MEERTHDPVPDDPPMPSAPARTLEPIATALAGALVLLALAALATRRVIDGGLYGLFAVPAVLLAAAGLIALRNARSRPSGGR